MLRRLSSSSVLLWGTVFAAGAYFVYLAAPQWLEKEADPRSQEFLPRLGGALLLLVVGFIAASWAARAARRVPSTSERIDRTIVPVLAAVLRYGILIICKNISE